MSKVLLYNITDSKKLLAIRLELARAGISIREVAETELTHPLGYLLGMEGFAPGLPGSVTPFPEEMMVMEGLRGPQLNQFLDALRSRGASIALKAVVTEHNVNWSSLQLYRELQMEHRQLSGGKQSIHRKA